MVPLRRLFASSTIALLSLATGCIDLDPDPAQPDAGSSPDGGTVHSDASAPDTGSPDGGPPDSGPPIVAPDGFNTARILYRGSEAMLFHQTEGHALTIDNHDVMSYSLSGDGQVVWLAVYYGNAEGGPSYRVFSMDIDGTDVQESDVVRPPDAPFFPRGFRVRTTQDGELAVLTQYTKDAEGRVIAEFSRAARGEAFSVLTTSDGEVEALGLAQTVHTEVTADGRGIIFTTGRNIWRANEGEGWVPFVVTRVEDLTWNGEALPGNASFRGLDITDSGGEFATQVAIGDRNTAVIVGTGIGATAFEAVEDDGKAADFLPTVEIDGVGEVVTYSHALPARSWIGPKGGTHDEVTVPIGTVRNVDLADDGLAMHAVMTNRRQAPFFQTVGGDDRVASMSPTWITLGSVPTISGQLSDDGSVFVTPVWGLIATHREVNVYGASVDAIFWRYDDDGNLVVRVEASGTEEVKVVSIMPLVDRYYRPALRYDYTQDPLHRASTGEVLDELEDEPGTYEITLIVDPESSLSLEERYSFRVTVGQGGPPDSRKFTSNAFADFDLFQ